MNKTFFLFLLCIQIFVSFSVFGETTENQKHMALLMPNEDIENLNISVKILKKELEAKGYKISYEQAQNNAALQISQIEKFIAQKADMLIITAVNPYSIARVLLDAKQQGIKIIAFDRFIENIPLDYYVSFDAFKIGVLEGRIIERALGLNIQQKGPFYCEIFSSPQEYAESFLCYQGAMSVFEPYIEKNRLRNISSGFSFDKTALKSFSAKEANIRMSALLSKFYISNKLDAVLCLDDVFALGVIEALKKAEYKINSDKKKKAFPVIAGQNCRRENIKALIEKEQTASVFKDYRILAKQTAEIAESILKGKIIFAQKVKYKMSAVAVPALLLEAKIVYKSDIQKNIFDSNYYKKSEILKIK